MAKNRIPVTIITGFLGAGKTTLINKITEKYDEKRFAIIENEFGEIGIDGDLIVGSSDGIFELSDGCICCSINDDFIETLYRLIEYPGKFNHLLVETTGIADPDSVVKAFLSTPEIQVLFELDAVICLIDALNFEDVINEQTEVRKQLALADIALITKIDLVRPGYLEEIKSMIQKLNPLSSIIPLPIEGIAELDILDTFAFSGRVIEQKTSSFKFLTPLKNGINDAPVLAAKPNKINIIHDIGSEGFILPGSFDMELFSTWMENFLCFNATTVFRVKGILSLYSLEERVIFQAVRNQYMFDRGDLWASEPRHSKLVFIGKSLLRLNLMESLSGLLVKEQTGEPFRMNEKV